MKHSSYAGRCAVWSAVKTLKEDGYTADRCAGRDRTFDLIAWNKEKVLALCIRSTRKPDITRFRTEITRLSGLVYRRTVPGTVQIWLYHPGGVTRYQVLPGGALFIREGQV